MEVKTVYLTYKNHFIIVLIKYMFFNIIKYFFKTIKVIIMLKKTQNLFGNYEGYIENF